MQQTTTAISTSTSSTPLILKSVVTAKESIATSLPSSNAMELSVAQLRTTIPAQTFSQETDLVQQNVVSVIQANSPSNYSRILTEYTPTVDRLPSTPEVNADIADKILKAFLEAKKSRDSWASKHFNQIETADNSAFSGHLKQISDVTESQDIIQQLTLQNSDLANVFNHLFQTWGLESIQMLSDLIVVPNGVFLLVTLGISHSLYNVWVVVTHRCSNFRIGFNELRRFYTQRLNYVRKYMSEINIRNSILIPDWPHVRAPLPPVVMGEVGAKILAGAEESKQKIDEKVAETPIIPPIETTYWTTVISQIDTNLEMFGVFYTVPRSLILLTRTYTELSNPQNIARVVTLLVGGAAANLVTYTFTGYNPVGMVISRLRFTPKWGLSRFLNSAGDSIKNLSKKF